MKDIFKKTITTVSIIGVLLVNTLPALAYTAPTAPEAPQAPTTDTTATTQSTDSAPTPPLEPTFTTTEPTPPPAPQAPTLQEMLSEDPPEPISDQSSEEQSTTDSSGNTSSTPDSTQTGDQSGNQTGSQSADGQVGSTSLDTGTATNSVGLITTANNNLSGATIGNPTSSGISVINSDNGSSSDNSGSVSVTGDSTQIQDNTATVTNSLTQTTSSGDNSASSNVGDTTLTTGDANTTGTIINAVNTNIDGVMVAEFNVIDDHVGDIVLDFSANCIVGCSGTTLLAENSGNGTSSENDATIDLTQNNNTFQNNDATLLNEMSLDSNTGNNVADKNTNGDTSLETGDANVEANILNFANNNISGNVILGVVNIYGDLVGDIIFPEEYLAYGTCTACSGGNLTAINSGNGTSQNSATIDKNNTDNTFQYNDATLETNIIVDAQTGDNKVSQNTGGDSSITTGDTNVDVNVLNVANSNINGGDWWLVLVNEAGNWIGRILGVDGQNYAGSEGTEFIVNEYGEITATNSGNGTGSNNTASVSSQTNNTLVQSNTANVVNNVNLSANTGGNSASKNTGGSSSVETGDASIIANIVNFVNNNFSGNGRLYVTVVNVFGSWIGNFVTPLSQAAAEVQTQAAGGPNPAGGTSSGTNNGTTGSSNTPTTSQASNDSQSQPGNQTQSTNHPLLAGFTTGGAGLSFPIQVASFVSGVTTGSDDSIGNLATTDIRGKKIKINLAWFLPLIPLTLLGLWLKRRMRVSKTYLQKLN